MVVNSVSTAGRGIVGALPEFANRHSSLGNGLWPPLQKQVSLAVTTKISVFRRDKQNGPILVWVVDLADVFGWSAHGSSGTR
jgi:hypothetical protein